ncbi:MAG TPA: hypothetical protein VGY53_00895 [Isosphaeraceae bacterium]|nr:hypothetical protein [Isosphaeraceae bacterium]
MSTNAMAGIDNLNSSFDYQDTVALLQEEIIRLEEELRIRDEASSDASGVSDGPLAADDLHAIESADAGRIAELNAEILRRDETIALLLEEIARFEEAEAAARSEWEQLNQWVTQVEQRVDSRDRQDSGLAQELATERRKSEAQRQAAETEKRASESQRRLLEQEVERLRGQLAEVAKRKTADPDAELGQAALEGENRRLRRMCDELTRTAAAAGEVETLRKELRAAQGQLDEAQTKLRSLDDDMERERKEHQAALAASRTQLARVPLERQEAVGDGTTSHDLSLVTGEERMLAFRQHLQEIHKRELEEHAQKRLSARLSRLWRRTGPSQ